MRKHLCGTPAEGCTGTLCTVDKEGIRTHATALEAFECHRQYLISRGFVPVGTRELVDPADGCVRVLTKKIRFGASVRRGKGTDGGSAVGNRLADMDAGAPRILSL
ncbi:MAG TPA: hypothetical protein VH475_04270 [Tepidisphaeraceae bacterium]|jgi:hypothetical protein